MVPVSTRKAAPSLPSIGAPGERVACRVERDVDRFAVQHEVRWTAERLGFAHLVALELAIVASELASNILKYGKRGSIVIEAIEDPARGRGVRIIAFDEGEPFLDFERALCDGSDELGPIDPAKYAIRKGIGSGLGAVKRFSDACGWAPEPVGKQVWAVRWLRRG